MFGLSKFLRRTSEAAQQAEMSQIGLEFTNLAEAGEGERAVKKFVQLVACQPTWTQFHFEAMDFVVRKGMLGNTLYDPLQDAAENDH